MSLNLEYDNQSHVQEHLNELTARVTLVLFLSSLFTIFWLYQIDSMLDSALRYLNPCSEGCLNLYDPARWSAVRWMSAASLGIVSAFPVFLHQSWKFIRPGLLPSERRWLKSWLLGTGLMLLITISFTIGYLFPMAFDNGHATHVSMKLDARYDAILMISMVVAVIWAEIIVACGLGAMVFAGILGLLNKETADWWRIRVHGLVALLLLASLPDYGGLAIMLTFASIIIVERGARKWIMSEPPLFQGKNPIMDHEGGIRRILLVECVCNDSPQPYEWTSKIPIATISVESLCSSVSVQEQVLEISLHNRLTDLLVIGCKNSMPNSFFNNCNSIGCAIWNECEKDDLEARAIFIQNGETSNSITLDVREDSSRNEREQVRIGFNASLI